MTRKLTWLHLSDLHARKRDDWDAREIKEKLVQDLKFMQAAHGLRPDLIFFTGDLAFGAAGTEMMEQYKLVRDFLDSIRKAFDPEIPIRDIYLVPGNHDIDREEITPEQTEWLRHKHRKLDDIIAAMRDGKKQWRTWMERLENYRNFLISYGLTHLTPDDPHLIWADAREIEGLRVGIAGLNSAWSCANDEDKAKLWFGVDWQIAQVKQNMGDVDFAFVLAHHPGNWFTEHEDPKVMRRLRQEFHIVLHGHEHQEWVEPDTEGRMILSAGACYQSTWMDNGYNFGSIDLDQRTGGIHLRQWDSAGCGWVPRNIAGKTKNGLWSLTNLSWLNCSDAENKRSSSESFSSPDSSTPSLGQSAQDHFTQRYCEHVIKQHDVLELFGCDIPRELQRHQLSVAYVSLNLAQEDEDQPFHPHINSKSDSKSTKKLQLDGNEELHKDIDNSSAAVEHVLDSVSKGSGRLLINGSAGAGKSTLMRWCAIHAAQNIIDEPVALESVLNQLIDEDLFSVSENWRRKIPLLIRLRDCPAGQLPSANELPNFLAKHLPSAPLNWMTNVLDSGRALILFDGVDEIHKDQRPQLANEIGELINTYPKCTYVVTTRPGAVESGWLTRLNFTEARVEPMSRSDREEFIDKWYQSAALELKKRPRPGEDLNLTASRLKAELVEQPELGKLASNPLLCAMICALYRERNEKLPETPAELSEALCHMLLHRRERETVGLGDKHFLESWRALQYSQKKELLAELAWHMVSNVKSSIERAEALRLVAKGLASTPGRAVGEAEEVLQALIERSGLLRPASDDRIDFLHNTLKEYLAAGKVVGTGEWQILTQHADDPAWQPVILFALAIAPEQFSSALVGDLLARVAPANSPVTKTSSLTKAEQRALATIKSRQFFLVRCRATAKQLAADLSNVIDRFLKNLLPPVSMNEAEALALLGPRILLYGTRTLENGLWWTRQNGYMVTRCLRLLRLVGGTKAKAALKAVRALSTYSTQTTNEWILACGELSPEERLPWPFYNKKVVNLSSSRITDISLLEDLSELQQLRLERTNVTSLSPLIKLTSLQSLTIWFTPVSDLKPLAELASLKVLVLFGTQVVDLSPLRGIIGLKQLDCDLTKVHDLSPIAGLIALEYLDLSRTPVVNIKPLKNLVNLKGVSMHGTKVVDIEPLREMTVLQSLNLENTAVEDISVLAELTSLQILNLSGTKVTNIEPLRHSASIKTIRLNRVLINDLSPLAGLSSLETLELNQINVADLSPLSKIKSLKHIHLGKTAILKQELENFKRLRPDILIH
jgi:Leucine-rich repeat (LRR) protein/predicted MPP superfamily phosphohydrolase